MKTGFADKVVIVTGASSGIGQAAALAFAKAGARVALAARNDTRLQEVIASLPSARERLRAIPTDVTRDEDVQRLFAQTVTEWGRVDILVNNAGIGMRAPVAETAAADIRRVMEVNFFGVVRCLQQVLPLMRRQAPGPDGRRGQIVNIGSILSMLATPQNGVYAASKFALRALSDALRLEERPHGIDVILIMPGYTDTAFFENMIRYDGPARTTSWQGQSPAKVAAAILHACARHQPEVVLTISARCGAWTKRLTPRLLDFALARINHNP